MASQGWVIGNEDDMVDRLAQLDAPSDEVKVTITTTLQQWRTLIPFSMLPDGDLVDVIGMAIGESNFNKPVTFRAEGSQWLELIAGRVPASIIHTTGDLVETVRLSVEGGPKNQVRAISATNEQWQALVRKNRAGDLKLLGRALWAFCPDLVEELVARWKKADGAFEELMALLRDNRP